MATGMPVKQKRDSLSSGGLDTERFTFTFSIDVSSQIETCPTNGDWLRSNSGIIDILRYDMYSIRQSRLDQARSSYVRCYAAWPECCPRQSNLEE